MPANLKCIGGILVIFGICHTIQCTVLAGIFAFFKLIRESE